MILAAEQEFCHLGETAGIADHDHDLVHELSRRLDALWRYDQYIANAEWRDDLKQFWCDAKAMEQQAIQRIRELIDTPPPNLPAAIVLARANVDAYEWPAARNALANYSSADPTQGVCLLMAEIEEGQNADQGKAREWLARAVRAPRDPVWTADGITSDEWEPVSPVTGRLDAFEWRVPVSAVNGRPEPLPRPTERLPPPEAETSLAPTPAAQ